MQMLKGILVMARFALLEVLRKKVVLAGMLLTCVYLLLFGLGLHYLGANIGAVQRQLAGFGLFSMGFYLATFMTVLIAGFAGVGAISGEIESGTAYALLAEPVSRSQILLGKFVGYGLMMCAYAAFFFFVLWGLMAWQFGVVLPGPWTVLPLFLLQPLIILALAFWGSTMMSTLANGITIFLLYGIVLVAGMIEQIGAFIQMTGASAAAHAAGVMINIGIVSSLVLPVDALYRRAVFVLLSNTGNLLGSLQAIGPFGSVSVPSQAMVVYAWVYLVGCLLLAVRSFKRRDI
jgi:ABC-type transport system involved in multi-copper enzyme maturation permease subunit